MSLRSCLGKVKGFTPEEQEALLKEQADAVNKGESEDNAAKRIVRARLVESVENRQEIEKAVEKAVAAAPLEKKETKKKLPRPPEEPNRRVLERKRAEIEDMSPAEKDVEIKRLRAREDELLVNPVSGLPGRRAFTERVASDKSIKAFAALDMDGLKWINENMGHEAGDRLLAAVGELLRSSGLEAFHIGGDEFAVVYHGERTALYEALEQVQEEAGLISLEFTGIDGKKYLKNGLDFSFATGKEFNDADHRVTEVKRARTERGLRAARGEAPVGMAEVAAEDGERGGEAAEVAGPKARLSEIERRKRDVTEVRQTADGRLIGAPPGAENERGRAALVRRIAGLLNDPLAVATKSHDWYERSGDAIRQIAHGDHELAEKIIRLFALYSQGNSVGGNTTAVIKSMAQIARGDKDIEAGRFPNQTRDVIPDLLAADEMSLDVHGVNNKVLSFYRNLSDATFQTNEYPEATTLDRWMMRLFGYQFAESDEDAGATALSPTQYAYARDLLARVINRHEQLTGERLLPRQAQSILWSYVKNKKLFNDWKVARQETRDSLAAARATKDAAGIKKAQDRLEKLKDFDPENVSFADYINRAMANVTWETMPGRVSPMYDIVKNLGRNEKSALHRVMTNVIRDAQGRDVIMEKLGTNPLYAFEFGSGAYDGSVAPNTVTGILTNKDGGKVDSSIADVYASAVSYVYRQDAYSWHRPDPTLPRSKSKHGLQIEFSRDLTEDELETLETRLSRVIPGAGFTMIGERIARALNTPNIGIPDQQFTNSVLNVLQDWDIDAENVTKAFRAESEYVERGENDENYLQRIGTAGRSDLQGFLDSLRESADRTLRGFLAGRSRPGPARERRERERIPAVERVDYSTEGISVNDRNVIREVENEINLGEEKKRKFIGVRPSPTGSRANEVRAAQRLASLFGKHVVWIKDTTGDGKIGVGAMIYPGSPAVVLNLEAPSPLVSLLGHELFHDMVHAMTDQERKDFFAVAIPHLIENEPDVLRAMGNIYGHDLALVLRKLETSGKLTAQQRNSLEYVAEEVLAEYMGALMNDPSFWAELADQNPSLFEKVINAVIDWLNKTIASMRNSVIPEHYREYWDDTARAAEGLRDSLVEVAGEYSKRKGRFILQAGRLTESQAAVRAQDLGEPRRRREGIPRDGMLPPNERSDRFNQMGTNIGGARDAVGSALQALRDKGKDYLPLGLQFLGRRQLTDIYGDLLPPMRQYNDEVQRMDAEKSIAAHRAADLTKRWGNLKPELADRLADLMHEATLAQIDPAQPVGGSHPGKFDRAIYDRLRAEYINLGSEAQAIYREARDMHKDQWSSVKDALVERIQRAMVGGKERQQLIDEVRSRFEEQLRGVYFPLSRFGDYFVTVKKINPDGTLADDNEEVRFAESIGEARREQAALQGQYGAEYRVSPIQKRETFNASQQGANKEFVGRLFQMIENSQGNDAISRAAADGMIDAINQLYLSSLPDLSWAKHAIHRKGVKGYSRDARRAFAQNLFHGGYHLARLNHADILQDQLHAMREHIAQNRNNPDFDTPAAVSVLNEMISRHEETLSPDNNPISNFLTGLGFLWHMGLSPATAIVNLSQTALVAYPVMSARFGVTRSTAALLGASREALATANRMDQRLQGAEKTAYDRAVQEGVIDVTMAHDLAGVAEGRDSLLDQKWAPVMKAASFLFHEAELFNRQTTFMAGFRLAKGEGMSDDAAYDDAAKLVYDSHFDYAASNRPRVMTGPVARVILLFKQYAQNMIYTIGRSAHQAIMALDPADRAVARRQLVGLLTMHSLAAGALGLPWIVSGALLSMASMLGSDADDPWDAEIALRNYLSDAVGKDMAEVILRGLPRALLPGDLSGRVGLNQLLFRDGNPALEGAAWYEDMANSLLGPVAGIGLNLAKGMADVQKGNTAQGIEQLLPVSISNPLKAVRYNREGVVDRTGVTVLEDTTYGDELAQALGFSPGRVKEAYAGRSAVLNTDKRIMKRREQLLRDFSMGVMEGDEDRYQRALDHIAKFNDANPAVVIKGSTLRSSLKNRLKRINEADSGVYLPKERRGLAELGRFANVD